MADEIERLVKDMGGIPKDLRKKLRPGLRKAGRIVAEDAKLRSSWSTRIPRAIRVTTTFSGKNPGVRVQVNKKNAPHARPFEHGGGPGTFRHPVFGNRKIWVSQRARPFLAPALAAKNEEAGKKIAEVVDQVTRDAGFR
jgi:hypothetical protein